MFIFSFIFFVPFHFVVPVLSFHIYGTLCNTVRFVYCPLHKKKKRVQFHCVSEKSISGG